jgi:hypothetical protein
MWTPRLEKLTKTVSRQKFTMTKTHAAATSRKRTVAAEKMSERCVAVGNYSVGNNTRQRLTGKTLSRQRIRQKVCRGRTWRGRSFAFFDLGAACTTRIGCSACSPFFFDSFPFLIKPANWLGLALAPEARQPPRPSEPSERGARAKHTQGQMVSILGREQAPMLVFFVKLRLIYSSRKTCTAWTLCHDRWNQEKKESS